MNNSTNRSWHYRENILKTRSHFLYIRTFSFCLFERLCLHTQQKSLPLSVRRSSSWWYKSFSFIIQGFERKKLSILLYVLSSIFALLCLKTKSGFVHRPALQVPYSPHFWAKIFLSMRHQGITHVVANTLLLSQHVRTTPYFRSPSTPPPLSSNLKLKLIDFDRWQHVDRNQLSGSKHQWNQE